MKNPAVSGGASADQAGKFDEPKFTAKSQHKQDQRRWRGVLRRLADDHAQLIDEGDAVTQAELNFAYRWRK